MNEHHQDVDNKIFRVFKNDFLNKNTTDNLQVTNEDDDALDVFNEAIVEAYNYVIIASAAINKITKTSNRQKARIKLNNTFNGVFDSICVCTATVESFHGISAAPSAFLDDQWKCRVCGKFAAEHDKV